MKKIFTLLLIFSIFLNAKDYTFTEIVNMTKNPATQEKGNEELFKLVLKGNTKAMTQLGLSYIYSKSNDNNKTRENCRKGILFLFSALKDRKKEGYVKDIEAMKQISLLFLRGICVKKDYKKYLKYKKRYEKLKNENKDYLENPLIKDITNN